MDAIVILGVIATIVGTVIAVLQFRGSHGQEDVPKSEESQEDDDGPSFDSVDIFARRYLNNPSYVRFIEGLPKLKEIVLESARSGWDTGVTAVMRESTYLVVDFLEFAWLWLSGFYPQRQWYGQSAEEYIAGYISSRFDFHRLTYEPEGPGTGGTIIGVLAGGAVIDDLEKLIADTVDGLVMGDGELDYIEWKRKWFQTDRPVDPGWPFAEDDSQP